MMKHLQWTPALLVWSLLGCQAEPPEHPPEPPLEPDHLAEDVKQLGEELLACRQAENVRLHQEVAALDMKIAKTKAEIAVYCRLLGQDAGSDCARFGALPWHP